MSNTVTPTQSALDAAVRRCAAVEQSAPAGDEHRHPVSRWYLLPVMDTAAAWLVPTRVRPTHITLLGAVCAAGAVTCIAMDAIWWLAPLLVMAAWCCDRIDGRLARRQGTASALGAWLDANLDELTDVALQAAVAAAAVSAVDHSWPWAVLLAFVAGKYLLFIGMQTEREFQPSPPDETSLVESPDAEATPVGAWLRWLYHLPSNADVRVHFLALCLAGGWLVEELVAVALYYNLRWMVRYALVIGRLRARSGCDQLSATEGRS